MERELGHERVDVVVETTWCEPTDVLEGREVSH